MNQECNILKIATKFSRPNKYRGLKMGLVGLPNVGKSTLFNQLTHSNVKAENFPFCTTDPHTGHVEIQDDRLDFLSEVFNPKKKVHATLEIVDIAGLVKGSSDGCGLGNQFLDNIRNVDGIFLVVRCFDQVEITHYEGDVNPLRDIDIIDEELRFKDIEHVKKAKEVQEKALRADVHNKKIMKNIETCKRMLEILRTKWIVNESWEDDEINYINSLILLTTKKVILLANISEKDFVEKKVNKHLASVIKKYGNRDIIAFSAKHTDEKGFLDQKMTQKMVIKGYDSLNLMNFFTAGKDEVKSWTIRRGMSAPEAAGVIHSDFEKYFVNADVMGFDDFKNYPSEAKMREAGKLKQKGKTYVVESGDIMFFKANVPKGKKK